MTNINTTNTTNTKKPSPLQQQIDTLTLQMQEAFERRDDISYEIAKKKRDELLELLK